MKISVLVALLLAAGSACGQLSGIPGSSVMAGQNGTSFYDLNTDSSGNLITASGSGGSYAPLPNIPAPMLATGLYTAPISVSASPFSYTVPAGGGLLAITAGTVSSVVVTHFGSQFTLPPANYASSTVYGGDVVVVTYSGTPTMTLAQAFALNVDATGALIVSGGGGMVWPAAAGIAICTGTPCTAWGTSITTSAGMAAAISDETGTGLMVFNTSPTFATSITVPVVSGGAAGSTSVTVGGSQGGVNGAVSVLGGSAGNTGTGTVNATGESNTSSTQLGLVALKGNTSTGSGTGKVTATGGANTTSGTPNSIVLQPTSAINGLITIMNAQGGGVAGGSGQTVAQTASGNDSNNYGNPLTRYVFTNNGNSKGILEWGCEGGLDNNGNSVQVVGTSYGTDHCYFWNNLGSFTFQDFQPNLTLSSATTTTSSNTVTYTGPVGRMKVGDTIFGVGMGLPASATIATVTPGTGFTYTGTAVTTGATGNIYVNDPVEHFYKPVEIAQGLSLQAAVAPAAATCGSGTVATGGTDNAFKITGISAATACTVTTVRPLTVSACLAQTSGGLVATPTITTTQTNSVIVLAFALLTGTITAFCF